LFGQLAEQGRLILPLGSSEFQELTLVEKRDGQAVSSRLEGCRFVPLIGAEGFAG
jgi:protein-L-isoaspartate(D-aspartate) O-methyltransferase